MVRTVTTLSATPTALSRLLTLMEVIGGKVSLAVDAGVGNRAHEDI